MIKLYRIIISSLSISVFNYRTLLYFVHSAAVKMARWLQHYGQSERITKTINADVTVIFFNESRGNRFDFRGAENTFGKRIAKERERRHEWHRCLRVNCIDSVPMCNRSAARPTELIPHRSDCGSEKRTISDLHFLIESCHSARGKTVRWWLWNRFFFRSASRRYCRVPFIAADYYNLRRPYIRFLQKADCRSSNVPRFLQPPSR